MKSSPIIGSSELAGLIRAYDWSTTAIGPISAWPSAILATVNLALQSPIPIVMLFGDDGIMIYNDGYSEFAGKRHPQLLGSKVVEGWPEVADFNTRIMQEVYHKGTTLEYKDQELILYRNNQREQLWTDLTYSPVVDETGARLGVFAVVIETTERILAEEREQQTKADLSAERERLQSIFSQAPALIAVLRGPNHVFELANQMYIQTVAPHRDIVGKPLLEAVPELAGQGIVEILNDVLKTGKAYVGELTASLDADGSGDLKDGYFNLVYQPIRSTSDGEPDGIFVHAVDITQQVLSLRRAESLNAELEAVFESLPDGVITTDDKQIRHINERGALNLGFTSVDDVPRDLQAFYNRLQIQYSEGRDSPVSVDLTRTSIGRALRGEVVDNGEVKVENTKTGVRRIVRSAAAPILNQTGEVIGTVATTSDLTAQYELREKMQKEIVRRRVLSQRTKLLKEQNDSLMALNQTKDEFIALTSHQLRTPATGVKQYIGMITQGFAGEVTPQQRDFLERAYESNDRQLQIIDDILRVSRIDLDEIKIKKMTRNVAEFLRELLAEQAATFAGRNQMVVTHLDDTIDADIDPYNLGMAIGNIVDNASKYTPDGKTITISAATKADCVIITVQDEGVGIAEADMGKLFQKFSRIPNDRSILVGGTGLGLYLSQKLIEKHGGSVEVASKLGKGTTFTISLPHK